MFIPNGVNKTTILQVVFLWTGLMDRFNGVARGDAASPSVPLVELPAEPRFNILSHGVPKQGTGHEHGMLFTA